MERETIHIENFNIEVVRKPRLRRLSLKIQTSGDMRLSVGVGVPIKVIKSFLFENLEWMKKTTDKFQKIRDKNPPKKFEAGERFSFLGEPLQLLFVEGPKVSLAVDKGRREMTLTVPPETSDRSELAKHYIRDFYAQVGRKYVNGRIDAISEQMKLKPKAISFRSQKTRWGSCSSTGRVTFNWRLAIAPPAVIDYVIIHELAHLKHMDHSERFWALVEKYCPEHKKLKKWLNKNRYESDFLADKSELHSDDESEDGSID